MSLTPRLIIARAMRMLGTLAPGDNPSAADLADAMTALNTLKRSLFGTVIGPVLSSYVLTRTSGQAENGGEYAFPATAFTLAAPLNPRAGARFGVVDANLSFPSGNLTLNPNGRLIQGQASNLTLSTSGFAGRWWYRADTGNWVLEADYATADDVVEFPDNLIAFLPYMLAVAFAPEFNSELRQDVIAGNSEGRAAFFRAYGRRGRNLVNPPIGAPVAAPPAAPQGQG
jgi:hypothetical protein